MLIVEDEEVLRELYLTMLSTDGYEKKYVVRGASSAEEAKEFLSSEDYDVVLTDYKLPGESGIDLIRWASSQGHKARCIILSGFLESSIVKAAFEAGAILCLKKPCSVDKILSAVDQAAQQRGDAENESFLIESVIEANATETLFVDTEYRIRFANHMFVDNYGSCVGKKCYQIFGTGSGVCPDCQAVASVEERKSRTRFRTVRNTQGRSCEIQERVDPWYTGEDNLLGLVLSFSKVGLSSKQEPEAELSQPQVSEKQDENRVLVFALDEQGCIAYAGEQFVGFIGLDWKALEGKPLREFLDKSFVARLDRTRESVVSWFIDNAKNVVPLNIVSPSLGRIATFVCETRVSEAFSGLGWRVLIVARRDM